MRKVVLTSFTGNKFETRLPSGLRLLAIGAEHTDTCWHLAFEDGYSSYTKINTGFPKTEPMPTMEMFEDTP